jgi:hypothetical protein
VTATRLLELLTDPATETACVEELTRLREEQMIITEDGGLHVVDL